MEDMFLFIPDPPRHQSKWVGMIGVGLLIGVFLFVVHIADKRPPYTVEITMCTGNDYGDVVFVTVEGTVFAHTKLNQTHLTAFANQQTVGTASFGDFVAGQQKPFRVTGNISSLGGKPLSCRVELRSQN